MVFIRRCTVARNHDLIVKLVRLPPEEREEQFVRIYQLLELKAAAHCAEARQELKEFGEIVTVLRAVQQPQHA